MTVAAFIALGAFVMFGSIIPVVPTGPAVSGAAVVAGAVHSWELVLVVLIGAAGAYGGDLVTYGALRIWGEPLAQRVGWLQRESPQNALARLRHRLERNGMRTLLVSRLVPGGRIPVLVAAALGGFPLIRYAVTAIAAAGLWALTYAVIGVIGDSLVPDPELAVVTTVVAAVLISLAAGPVHRWITRSRTH